MTALFLLLLFTALWYLLAFLPALRELWLRTDVRPLRVIGEYDGSAAYFARSSLAFISANFPGKITREEDQRIEGVLDNGTPYTMLPFSEQTRVLHEDDIPPSSIDHVLISYAPVRISNQIATLSTVYAARELIGGVGAVYRAMFGDSDIWLAQNSIVLRWIHSETNVLVHEDSKLYGRVSAGIAVRLLAGCTFERVAAPRIELGEPSIIPVFVTVGLNAVEFDHLPERGARRHVAPHSITIPPSSFVGFDLISSGAVRIGEASWVSGSVKAGGDVFVEPGVRIDGSIVAEGSVFVGANSLIRGPVIAEANVLIDGPTRIGSPTQPSTVTAPCIYCSAGVVVYGSLWAREGGVVEHPSGKTEELVPPPIRVVAA